MDWTGTDVVLTAMLPSAPCTTAVATGLCTVVVVDVGVKFWVVREFWTTAT